MMNFVIELSKGKGKRSPELRIHDCLLTSIKTKVLREQYLDVVYVTVVTGIRLRLHVYHITHT